MSEGNVLNDAVAVIIERHKDKAELSPSWIATEAMKSIGFARATHEVGYIGCHLHFRQISRAQLRRRFDPTGKAADSTEDDLFPETLQERYPLKPTGDEPVYVLLELLSDADAIWNEERMRKASLALQKHADAMLAWRLARRKTA